MITVKCKCCGDQFHAREADRKRGWARFCSKSCKAIDQTRRGGRGRRRPRHDGVSPMKHKKCADCGDPAVNGIYGLNGRVEWFCAHHMAVNSAHPFSSEAFEH